VGSRRLGSAPIEHVRAAAGKAAGKICRRAARLAERARARVG